ncbi:hypothetical protein KGM_204404 [Danaus plexippus plexippus]|uniref:Uncharacterized protein n=1 Tax=Danaus plexippus plexippus TaxID=278856 RepID=A0A212F3Z7_DANPL|nr:hypothetical protein KGM_204404 [Danaus plexippus plexippus]
MMTSTPKSEKCIQGEDVEMHGASTFTLVGPTAVSQGSRASAAAPLLRFAPFVIETSREQHAPLTISSFVRCSGE